MASFLPEIEPTKMSLIKGIEAWVRERVNRPHANLYNLDRLNFEDLLFLAMAMGYVPHEKLARRIAQQDDYGRQRHESYKAQSDKVAAERLIRSKTIAGVKAEASVAVISVVAESLLTADDAQIAAEALVRGIDLEALRERIAALRNPPPPPTDD